MVTFLVAGIFILNVPVFTSPSGNAPPPPVVTSPPDVATSGERQDGADDQFTKAAVEFEAIRPWFGSSSNEVELRTQIMAGMRRMCRFDVSVLRQVAHLITEKAKQRKEISGEDRALNIL